MSRKRSHAVSSFWPRTMPGSSTARPFPPMAVSSSADPDAKSYWEVTHDEIRRHLRGIAKRSRGVLGRGRKRRGLDQGSGAGSRRQRGAVLSMVRRCRRQHLLQCHRPPRGRGPRRAARDHPRQPGHRRQDRHHLFGIARLRVTAGRRAGEPGRRKGRPGRDLYADDPGGPRCDAGLRPDWRGAFGRLWRICRS